MSEKPSKHSRAVCTSYIRKKNFVIRVIIIFFIEWLSFRILTSNLQQENRLHFNRWHTKHHQNDETQTPKVKRCSDALSTLTTYGTKNDHWNGNDVVDMQTVLLQSHTGLE
jgi:hypothetical protein